MILPIKEAIRALRTNKIRSALTVLGIIIGISSVIIILSAGQALQGFVAKEVSSFGNNIIQAEVKIPSTNQQSADNAAGMAMGITITTLKNADAEAVSKLINIDKIYSAVLGQDIASYKEANKVINIYGVTSQFIDIDQAEIGLGRFFSAEEERTQSQVVVLGPGIKKSLFGENDALGKLVKIGKLKYEVIGVLKEKGASLFFNMDDMIIMPLLTLQKKVMGIDHVSFFIATMKDPSQDSFTKVQIEDLLRERHNIEDPKKDDFAITTQEEMQDMLDTILGGIQMLLIAIASISLVVGGVGIMNIMYVTVAERTFEIGLRKSLGATQNNILWQFLWEAVFVTLAGGIIGVVIGAVVTEILTIVARNFNIDFTFTLPWWSVTIAVGFATFIGLVFGIYPARKAAVLDPIEALRK
jgi:putative ABC transport system permease protein